ncbi:ATP-grasp domain-containing protein [Streptomyces sp. NPDC001393]
MSHVPNPVLHIGWAVQSVTALTRVGAQVTCVVTARDAAAARAAGATAVVVPDPTSVEDILGGLARQALRVADFGVVCSGLEFCLVQAAVVAELGGVRGTGSARTLAMRDKFVQKTQVRGAGLPTAACAVLDDAEAPLAPALRFPLVLKPLDGAGAKHTVVVRDDEAMRAAAGQDGPWLLEEFVPGREFFVDGVVRDGEIRLFSLSRYLQNLIEVHDGGLVAYLAVPEHESPDLYERTRSLAEAALKALDHHDGVFHLEVFWDGADAVFGECAARVGGGKADRLTELTFAVDLHEEWARAVLGLPTAVPDVPVRSRSCHGGVTLRTPQGELTSVPSPAQVLERPGVLHAEIRLAPGDTAPDFSAATNVRAGQALVAGADTGEVEARIQDLDTWFFDSVEVAVAE